MRAPWSPENVSDEWLSWINHPACFLSFFPCVAAHCVMVPRQPKMQNMYRAVWGHGLTDLRPKHKWHTFNKHECGRWVWPVAPRSEDVGLTNLWPKYHWVCYWVTELSLSQWHIISTILLETNLQLLESTARCRSSVWGEEVPSVAWILW